jgi:Fe-S cluster biogenesis protein NfuA
VFTLKARTALAGFVRAFEAPDPVLLVNLEPTGGDLPDVHLQLIPGATPRMAGQAQQDDDPIPVRFDPEVGQRLAGLVIDFLDGEPEGGDPGFLVRTAEPSGSRAPGPPSSPASSPASYPAASPGLAPAPSADLVQIQRRRPTAATGVTPPALDAGTETGIAFETRGDGLTAAPLDAATLSHLASRIRTEIHNRVNPLVESHGGAVHLVRLRPDAVAEVGMAGGCQGCAAAAGTLQEVVARILRKAVPELRGVEDVTAHAQGTNPFFAAL